MSILTSIGSGFECLYVRQNELDKLLSKFNLSIDDRYQIDKLKKEISDILTDILAMQSEDVLSSSFYLQVNEIEQELYNILEDRNIKLKKLVTYRDNLTSIVQEILSNMYSIDVLEKSFHINVQLETHFLDIKNHIKNKNICQKKILAAEFLKEKLDAYKDGIVDIILIANKNLLKEELSFERKQEIFKIFSSISLKTQRVKNHTKVYNEDIKNEKDDMYTLEYLDWFEKLYQENCKYIDLDLDSYYHKIKETLCNNVVNIENVKSMSEYIYNRYKNEIDMYLDKVKNIEIKVKKNIKRQLDNCLAYDYATTFEDIYKNIKLKRELPKYLKSKENCEKYESLIVGIDALYEKNVNEEKIKKDLQECITELFDENKYLEMYKYNSNIKSIQVANYRQYYISLLENAKNRVKEEYIKKMDDKILDIDIKSYTISILKKKINLIEEEISLIKNALTYINKNYRDFSGRNLKVYIDSIQKRYELNNLYDNVMAKKSNLVYKLMAKSKLTEETRYLYEFTNKKEIREKLQNEIIDRIFSDDNELKQELISNLA